MVSNPIAECVAGYQGDDSICTVGLCPVPSGACCVPNAMATCEVAEPLACEALGGRYEGNDSECGAVLCLAVLPPFVDALPILETAQPTSGRPGEQASYTFRLVAADKKLHRDLPPTPVWAVDDGSTTSFPGPTIEASVGNPVDIDWVNDLGITHPLAPDACYPGVVAGALNVAMTVQGAHSSSQSIGMPDQPITPGEKQETRFSNQQGAATLWYHDRTRGASHANNYLGLAGLYLLHDPAGPELPTGAQDVSLLLQDRTFAGDGTLMYPDRLETTGAHSVTLVNGKVWPYLEVAKGSYRFRIVNASGGRTFRLSLSNGMSMHVVAGGLGLVPNPISVEELLVAPGERVEVLVDFRDLATGTELVLLNDAPAPYPGFANQGVIPDVLKFVIGASSAPKISVPIDSTEIEILDPEQAREHRTFLLSRETGTCSPFAWDINQEDWEGSLIHPQLGTTEIWTFANTTIDTQPIHVDTKFQIINKRAFEFVDGEPVAVGEQLSLGPAEQGWKDTMRVPPGQLVTVVLRFLDYQGRFALHSNIYEHADNALLAQYDITTECGDGFAGAPQEQCDDAGESGLCNADCTLATCGDGYLNEVAGEKCDDANVEDGDGCSANCLVEPDDSPSGCGCNTGDSGGLGSVGLFLLAIAWSRRPRVATVVSNRGA